MSEPTREQPPVTPEVSTRSPWRVSRIPAHLGRARTSTVVLVLLFLAIGALYLNIRPHTSGTATTGTVEPAPVQDTTVPPEPTETTPAPETTTEQSPTTTTTTTEEPTPSSAPATTTPAGTTGNSGPTPTGTTSAPGLPTSATPTG